MILLDTHVLIWAQWEPRKLSRVAEATLRRAKASSSIAISAITVVELASLMNHGRIRTKGTIEGTIRQLIEGVEVLPLHLEAAMATSYFSLDTLPDPIDRIIAATARAEGIPLVTADERMQKCPLVKTIW